MICRLCRTESGSLSVVLAVVVLAAIFAPAYAWVADYFGYAPPLAQLFGPPNDLFADFFTLLASFPGGDRLDHGSFFGLFDFQIHPPVPNPYLGAAGLLEDPSFGLGGISGEIFTNLHTMPLTMAFCQISVRAMQLLGGAGWFFVSYALLAVYWIRIAAGWAPNWRQAAAWSAIGLLSYPFLFIIVRGNFYAGVAGVLLVHAMLLASRQRAPVLTAILLAVAINVRPNAALFALPILLFHWSAIQRVLPALCVTFGGVFAASLIFTNWLYADYTFGNFVEALGVYYRTYVIGDYGLAAGSSLYGALKFLIGYRPGLDFIALIPSALVLGLGAWGWMTRRLSDAVFLFLTATAYCLGSSVISDYHLMVFMAPLMLATRQARQGALSASDRMVCVASVLILIAKNVVYREDVSYQVVLNPAILLIAALVIGITTFRMPGEVWHRRLFGDQTTA